jgi:hypothetical protein
MGRQGLGAVGGVLAGISGAVRDRRRVFAAVAATVFLLNVALPPVVLAVARKPWDHISVNPWLRNLPAWLVSDEATWQRKAAFVWNAALYWVIASGTHDAADWGYTATVRDVARWLLLSLLFATYFALWAAHRDRVRACAAPAGGTAGRGAGVAGAVLSTVGFSTLPCSVIGCGAPVLPVLGLALSGLELTSQTLAILSRTAQAITLVVYAGVLGGIGVLARRLATGAPAVARGTAPAVPASPRTAPGRG